MRPLFAHTEVIKVELMAEHDMCADEECFGLSLL